MILLVDADRRLPTFGRKKCVTDEFQKIAEKRNLSALKEKQAKATADAVAKALAEKELANKELTDKETTDVIIEALTDKGLVEKKSDDTDVDAPDKVSWEDHYSQLIREGFSVDENGYPVSRRPVGTWNWEFGSTPSITSTTSTPSTSEKTDWKTAWKDKGRIGPRPQDIPELSNEQWQTIKDSNLPITYEMLKSAVDAKIPYVTFRGKKIDINKTNEALKNFMKRADLSTSSSWYSPDPIDLPTGNNDLIPVVVEYGKEKKTTLMDHLLSTGAIFKRAVVNLIEKN